MANIPGSVRLTGFIAPTDSADVFPVTDPTWGLGGLRRVSGITERDLISTERREGGMLVYSENNDTYYKLNSGLTNSDWIEFLSEGANTGVTAFIQIDEGNGTGYIVAGQDRTNFGTIGGGSFDLSVGDTDVVPHGLTGFQAFGLGYNIRGDGYAAITAGWDHINNGNYCIVNGISNTTSGGGSLLIGTALDNSGGDVMAIFGQANTLPSGNPFSLQVGNGSISAGTAGVTRVIDAVVRSDSFRVYKNGSIEAPSLTNANIDSVGDKSLITKEYLTGYTGGLDKVLSIKNETNGNDIIINDGDTINLTSITQPQLSMYPINASSPVDGSMWFTVSGGTTLLNYRISGLTKSVELT